jgi:uncharacterized membrane protein HdeD (DUF308 family)/predicted flap endonuclease-1-like 5' DNA nuclease
MSDYSVENAFSESRMPWWFLLIDGIVAIIIGILLLMSPVKMSIILVQALALFWLIKGVISIVGLFVDRSAWGWKLFIGVVGIIGGYVLIKYPIGGTAVVAQAFIIVLGIQGLLIGVVELVQAFQGAGWGTGILGGLTTLIGLWLLANAWLSARMLPWVLGILGIFAGMAAIVYAFRIKRAEHEAELEQPEDTVEPAEVTSSEELPEEEVGEAMPADAMEAVEVGEDAKVESEEESDGPPTDEVASAPKTAGPGSATNTQTIEGIGPKYAETLSAQGVDSVEALLEAGSTPQGRKELAEKSGISAKLILTWVNHADLMRIRGVGGEYAELLEAAGVDTVPELSRRNAENLHSKFVEVNEEKKLVRRIPNEEKVKEWIEEAKGLDRVVHY